MFHFAVVSCTEPKEYVLFYKFVFTFSLNCFTVDLFKDITDFEMNIIQSLLILHQETHSLVCLAHVNDYFHQRFTACLRFSKFDISNYSNLLLWKDGVIWLYKLSEAFINNRWIHYWFTNVIYRCMTRGYLCLSINVCIYFLLEIVQSRVLAIPDLSNEWEYLIIIFLYLKINNTHVNSIITIIKSLIIHYLINEYTSVYMLLRLGFVHIPGFISSKSSVFRSSGLITTFTIKLDAITLWKEFL